MARVTQTRQRVREIAEQLTRDGDTPTPGKVLAILGKGSPNTVVDELRKWKNDSSVPSGNSAPSTSINTNASVITEEFLSVLTNCRNLASSLEHEISAVRKSHAEFSPLLSLLQTVLEENRLLNKAIQSEREWFSNELQKIGDAFDGVQRHMLMSIEEARSEARRWRDSFQEEKSKADTWRLSSEGLSAKLQEQIAFLKGRISELSGEDSFQR